MLSRLKRLAASKQRGPSGTSYASLQVPLVLNNLHFQMISRLGAGIVLVGEAINLGLFLAGRVDGEVAAFGAVFFVLLPAAMVGGEALASWGVAQFDAAGLVIRTRGPPRKSIAGRASLSCESAPLRRAGSWTGCACGHWV